MSWKQILYDWIIGLASEWSYAILSAIICWILWSVFRSNLGWVRQLRNELKLSRFRRSSHNYGKKLVEIEVPDNSPLLDRVKKKSGSSGRIAGFVDKIKLPIFLILMWFGLIYGYSYINNKIETNQDGVRVFCDSTEGCSDLDRRQIKFCFNQAMVYGSELTAKSNKRTLPEPGRAVKIHFEQCVLAAGFYTVRCELDKNNCFYFPLRRYGYGGTNL